MQAENLANLDKTLAANEAEIKNQFPAFVSGLKTRVSTAVVVTDGNGRLYLYRRTSEGEERRGVPGKWDTPKGRVPFVADGKWNVPEENVSGEVVGETHAHEYSPDGKFAEFVMMPIEIFKADTSGVVTLDAYAKDVPEDMGKVNGYEWINIHDIDYKNAMTKVIAAAEFLKRQRTQPE